MTTRFPFCAWRRIFPCLLLSLLPCALKAAPAAAAQQPAVSPSTPNILFIIFDDWGWQHAGAYGSTWVKTPNFDRVAREGVLFKHAFTSNPKCSPCRASILTGRNSWQLKEAVSHNGLFPEGFEVYPDLLEKAGYAVGLTGKGWGPGDFKTQAKRTRNPAGPSFDEHRSSPPASGIGRNDYAKNFEAFLGQREKGKPFCFWMGFNEPHRAYELNSGVRLGKKLPDVTVPAYLPDTALVRGDLADYAIEVEWADAFIGQALAALEARGELENTLVVVTSDHGMPFPYVKGQIHEDGFRLPLAMRWGKGIRPGRVVEDFINVRDLAPTYLELAGIAPHPQITGRSLVALLRSPQSGWVENRTEMLVGKERHDLGRPNDLGYPVRALRTKDFLYVHNFHPARWPVGNPETDLGNCDPSPTKELLKAIGGHYYDLSFGKRLPDELYDLRTDPEGVNNLAHDLAYGGTLESMRARMMKLLTEEQDPRALGNEAIFDTYRYVGGRGKAYDTWLKAQEEKLQGTAPSPVAENPEKSRQEKADRPVAKMNLRIFLLAAAFAASGASAATKPNVIVIMSDDHGWADVAAQKHPASRDVLTPNLDRFFASGLRFTNGYVASSTCGPSRSSLMTGRTSSRFGMEDNQPGTLLEGPPAAEILIPQLVRQAGYRTGSIGKWHLGEAPDRLPAARGFDEFFGFLGGSHDFYRGPLTRGTKNESFEGYLTDVLAEGAVDFIQRHQAKPFFMYVAFNAPHSPIQAPQRLIERIVAHQPAFKPAYERMKKKTGAGALPNFDLRPFKGKDVDMEIMRLVYCAMVAGLDDGIGRILDALEKTGLRENTLIFFLADNGGALARPNDLGGVNLPLRSGKGSVFEGGVRVLFGASWPGVLPKGKDYDGILNAVDIFATTVTLAGGEIPKDRVIDGVDLLPYLTGKKSGNPHETFFFRRHDRKSWALRSGDFKWVVSPKEGVGPAGELYRISTDLAESKDVSAQFPEKKRELMAAYERMTEDLPKPVNHTGKPDVD